MNYQLKDAQIEDKAFIYWTKTNSIRKYVEPIWGWDEAYQTKEFEKDFTFLGNYKIICLNNEAIGFLETYESNEAINIIEIHINPAFQGKGIGSNIINDIARNAKQLGQKVVLGCFKENAGAVSLYQKLGFQLTNETKTHFVLEYN